MARRRRGAPSVRPGLRPVRGRSASWRRRRRARRLRDPRTRRGNRDVCRIAPDARPRRHDPDGGRVRRHARPPRHDRRREGRLGRRRLAVGTMGWSGTPEHAVPTVHLGIRRASDDEGYVDPLGLLPPRAAPAPAPTPAPAPRTDAGPCPGPSRSRRRRPAHRRTHNRTRPVRPRHRHLPPAGSAPAAPGQPAADAATPLRPAFRPPRARPRRPPIRCAVRRRGLVRAPPRAAGAHDLCDERSAPRPPVAADPGPSRPTSPVPVPPCPACRARAAARSEPVPAGAATAVATDARDIVPVSATHRPR